MSGLSEKQREEMQAQSHDNASSRAERDRAEAAKDEAERHPFARGFLKGVSIGAAMYGKNMMDQYRKEEAAKERSRSGADPGKRVNGPTFGNNGGSQPTAGLSGP